MLGYQFDCGSSSEIELVIKLGGHPDNIIFANPCKHPKHIKYAKTKGVKLLVIDSSEEVEIIQKIYPEAELILRIAVTETDAPTPMGKKYGAPDQNWESILDTCKNLNMVVRGVSFHVGSGGCSFETYEESINNAKIVFDLAESKNMQKMDILDIGGGFSQNCYHQPENDFKIVAPKVEAMLKQWPGIDSGIKVIGEPGRQISQEA